jgi:hypothetical protein
MHLSLFINHTYMFRSPSATILRMYSIKEYNKKLCVTIQSTIWVYKMLWNSRTVDLNRNKIIKSCVCR